MRAAGFQKPRMVNVVRLHAWALRFSNSITMQFKGIITHVGSPKSGVSKKTGKEWSSQEFVVRDDTGKYPESFVFEVFNKEIGASVGDEVEVLFEGDAREYNGRYFNSLKAYKVTLLAQGQVETPREYAPLQEEEGQLPF